MNLPDNTKKLLFGGTFVLSNKLQLVSSKLVKGLTPKQFFLLLELIQMSEKSTVTLTQLAKNMDSSRQNVVKMLEILERDKLVTLENSETDHRSRNVTITTKGRLRVQETEKNGEAFITALFEDISEEEREAAGNVILKMFHNLEKMQERLQNKDEK